jgi:hypothetical protein
LGEKKRETVPLSLSLSAAIWNQRCALPFPESLSLQIETRIELNIWVRFLLSRPRLSRKPEGDEKGGGSGK